jgi:hydroxyethylthiazole kinase-like uncharacterized protein yjeF
LFGNSAKKFKNIVEHTLDNSKVGILIGRHMIQVFDSKELKKLYTPKVDSKGEDNGQVTIIGGSSLFHGAPLLSLKTASRLVDMVFFSSPEPSVGDIASKLKSKLNSFIWVPWKEVGHYVTKSDAVLIGPGLMSYRSEKDKEAACDTKEIVKTMLTEFADKKWVVDAGALQTMEVSWIPKGAIITPNKKEFEILFGMSLETNGQASNFEHLASLVQGYAKKYDCAIVLKGLTTVVASSQEVFLVEGGNAGMTKGGMGDVQAGLTVALLAKNEPFLAATSAAYIVKAAADALYKKVGVNYNADDLAEKIPVTLRNLLQ